MRKPASGRRRLLTAGVLATLLAATASADDVLVTFRALSPGIALEMARAALEHCRNEEYQVSVAVVDRMGVTQVVLRDRYAGPHTPDTATSLAWTAVSFRTDTLALAETTKGPSAEAAARHIDKVVMIGGGVPVSASGSIVAGIGISGAPSGTANDACARAGIAAVAAQIELAD